MPGRDDAQKTHPNRARRSYRSGVRPLEDRVSLSASPTGSTDDDLLAANPPSVAPAATTPAAASSASVVATSTSTSDWYSSVAAAWFTSLSTSQLTAGGSAVQSTGNTSTGNTATGGTTSGGGTDADYSEWIVRLSASALESIHSVADAAQWFTSQSALSQAGLSLSVIAGLGLPGQLLVSAVGSAAAVEQYFATSDAFTYYEANRQVDVQSLPNDPSFNQLYALNNTGQTGGTVDADIDAPEAWNVSTGSRSVVVGIIDTGIDYNHVDLAANIWTNPGEIAGNGIDDDHNGFVDDVHGYDFANEDGDPMDDHYHGTHVAGTIGAVGNNGIGVAGVNWSVSLMALKFLDSSGSGTTANAIRAVNYATMMKTTYGVNVRVTNNSWGGSDADTALEDAINAGGAADILFVAAAGNDAVNIDVTPEYPAAFTSPYMITVAATDNTDSLAYFSNYGATGVDLAAPGVSIYSTTPGNKYATLSGTSMATPHVTGAAALALSVDPNLTALELKSAILANVDALPGLSGIVASGGRLNAAKLVSSLGLSVAGTSPAVGSTVTTPLTSFTVDFSQAYTPESVHASDFTVNGVAADSFTLVDSDSVAFTFATSPVTAQGVQTMSLATGGITRLSDGAALTSFTGTFRYDALLMGLVGSTPAAGSIVSLPFTTLDLEFNEAIDPSSIGPTDLAVSQGTVSGATLLNPTTIRFTLAGLANEGTFTYSIAAGALRDSFGNAGGAAAGSFSLDIGTVAMPAATAVGAAGSLVYRSTFGGSVGAVGDEDRLTIALDAGQQLALALDAAAGLTAQIELRSPDDVLLGSAVASAAGLDAVLQNVPIAAAGTYTIVVRGAAGSTGAYTINALLNTAVEAEDHNGPANDSRPAAQSLDGALSSLGGLMNPGGASARASVLGRVSFPGDADWYAVTLATGDRLFASARALANGSPNVSLYDASGAKLSDGTANSVAQSRDISNFVAAAGGTYYLVVTSTSAVDYQLQLGRNLELDRSGNINIASAQTLVGGTAGAVLGNIDGPQALGRLYVYDNATGQIREINKITGATIRAFAAPVTTSPGPDFGLATSTTTLLAGGSASYPIFELNPDTGAVIRTIGPPGLALSGLAFRNNEIFARTDTSDTITVFDYSTGNVLRTFGGSGTSEALAAGTDYLYAVNGSTIYVMNPADGTVISTRSLGVGTIEGLGVIGNELYASVNDTVYVFDRTTYGLLRTFNGLGDLEAIGADSGSSGFGDFYRVSLAAGAAFQASTSTPADGSSEFVNLLDAKLSLYDAAGNLVASDDDGAADGRNALLNYTPASGGTYYLAVAAAQASGNSTHGEYLLNYSGVATPASPFAVAAVDPPDGAILTSTVSAITLTFNDGVMLTSIDTSDVTVDGIASAAVTILDGSTIRFTLPVALTGGTHVVQVAAGALSDLQQTPLSAFTSTFSLDAIPPRVVATSISEGDVLGVGALAYSVTFSEAMRTANLDAGDFTLHGNLGNIDYAAASFSYNAAGTVLTITYNALPEDSYTLTLLSGDGRFEDAGGNDLDGEPVFPLPAGGSGNGFAGGNFVVTFSTDAATVPFGPTFAGVGTTGSMVYQSTANHSAVIAAAGDVDEVTLYLDAGQTLAVVVTPTSTLRTALEIIGPDGATIAAGQASAAGQAMLVQEAPVAATGVYRLRLSGLGGTTGIAAVGVTLNASLESSPYGGPAGNSIATAQNLDGSFVSLSGGSSRGAVLGSIGGTAAGSQNFSAIDSGWYTSGGTHDPNNQNYIVGLSNSGLMRDWFTFNLVGVTQTILSARLVLNEPFNGYDSPNPSESYVLYDVSTPIADLTAGGSGLTNIYDDLGSGAVLGVKSISAADDGHDLSIDLSAAAVALLNAARGGNFALGGALLGITGTSYQRIFGYSSGSSTRRLELTFSAPQPDYYSFTLAAGETASIGLKSLAAAGATLAVRDSAGNVLATGVAAPSFDNAISNFTAPSAGTYYVTVSSAGQGGYELVLGRDAVLDNGGNASLASAQSLAVSHSALGYLAAGSADYYSFTVDAGTAITLSTSTPGDGPGIFTNGLNPELTVYDSTGAVVASNADGGWEGRNARLIYDFGPGTYRVRVGATAGAGEYVLNRRTAAEAPTVTGVYVRSAAWTTTFLDYLGTNNLGNASISSLGYRLTSASGATLPWTNLDTLSLQFDRAVVVRQGDLVLLGSPDAGPPPGISGFVWDAVDNTATWTFDRPLSVDRYLIELNPAVAPAAGAGDDVLNEIYDLRFDAIPGDFDNSGSVAFGEIGQARLAIGQTAGSPGYDPRRDWDGSGSLTFADIGQARLRLGSSLSNLGAPVASPSPGILAAGDTPASIAAMAPPNAIVDPQAAAMSPAPSDPGPSEPAGSAFAEGMPPVISPSASIAVSTLDVAILDVAASTDPSSEAPPIDDAGPVEVPPPASRLAFPSPAEFVLITALGSVRSRPAADLFRPTSEPAPVMTFGPRFERLLAADLSTLRPASFAGPTQRLDPAVSEMARTTSSEWAHGNGRSATAADRPAAEVWKRLRRAKPAPGIGSPFVADAAGDPE